MQKDRKNDTVNIFAGSSRRNTWGYILTAESCFETLPRLFVASIQTDNKYAMADSVQNRRDDMKDSASLSETGSDKGDNSQGNKEDVFENDSGYVEERFRVDRKKLEQMLQGNIESKSKSLIPNV